MNKENIYRIDMKYIFLITFPFYSLSGMQKPAAKAKDAPTDEQILQIHEKVKAIRELQINDLNLIAARINAEFYTAAANFENPSASILFAQKEKAPSITVAIEDILEEKIKENTLEMQELMRRFTECQTALKDLQTKKLSRSSKKTYSELDAALERAHFVTAQQATHGILKKSAEITYYWSVLLERKSNSIDKLGVNQDA